MKMYHICFLQVIDFVEKLIHAYDFLLIKISLLDLVTQYSGLLQLFKST